MGGFHVEQSVVKQVIDRLARKSERYELEPAGVAAAVPKGRKARALYVASSLALATAR